MAILKTEYGNPDLHCLINRVLHLLQNGNIRFSFDLHGDLTAEEWIERVYISERRAVVHFSTEPQHHSDLSHKPLLLKC